MDDRDFRRLEAMVRLQQLPRARQLFRRPFRMTWSRLLKAWSESMGKARPLHARTFWGRLMRLSYPDGVSIAIHRYGFFEAGLTRLLLRTLKPGMVFFDVGAHFGYFSLLALDRVGPGGWVCAFEPTPSTALILKDNLREHGNASVDSRALYSREDLIQFTDYGSDFPAYNSLAGGHLPASMKSRVQATTYQVPTTTLDGFVAQSGKVPRLVKVDAEGAEEHILAGASRTLDVHRPLLTLEVGDLDPAVPPRSRALLQSVIDRGYVAMELNPTGERLESHPLKDRYDYDNILLCPQEEQDAVRG